jgi:DNA-binding NarL/FixJ family response regulator
VSIRVLVCDDSLGFPALVGGWLQEDPRFAFAGSAADGRELLDALERVEADVLVLDLVLPDVDNPAELVVRVRERRPGMRVLLVSSLLASELARAAAGAGVDGYVHKTTTSEQFLDEIERVAQGPGAPLR